MNSLDTLELLAEISIGLIGFAGVVTALGRSKLTIEIRAFRTRALLMNSALALFGSLLPVILFGTALSESTVWISSSITLAIAMTAALVWAAFSLRHLLDQAGLPAFVTISIITLTFFVLIHLLYSALFASHSLAHIYPVAVFWSLALGTFHFCMLVISIELPGETP